MPVAAPRKQPDEKALLKFSTVAATMDGGVDAGAPIGGNNILLFKDGRYAIYDSVTDNVTKPADIKTIAGWPKQWTKVDAAASWDDLTLVLFNGGEFIQYNTKTRTFRGDPEPITGIPNWPAGWTDGINGAANLDDDTLYLFHGSAYVTMSKSAGQIVTAPQTAKAWKGWPEKWTTGPTGTVEAPDGRVYFFRGSEFLPYDPDKDTFVAGAPKQLPGSSQGPILASWPPVAAPTPTPTGAGATAVGINANGAGNFVQDSSGNLRVTSIVPLNGGTLTGVNATALNLVTNKGNIPIAVSDPAHFDVNIAPGAAAPPSVTPPGTGGAGGGTASAIPYRDDYPANNDFQWEIPWVTRGADYLGTGYDPLTLNPANYGDVTARAPYQAVKLTTSWRRNLDGTLAAYCSQYSPGNTGQVSTRNTTVTTLNDYQTHFQLDASVTAGVPMFNATVGGGYSTFNNTKNGTTEIYKLRQSTIGLLRIRMDLTCFDLDTGNPYRQKLDLDFRRRVSGLLDPAPALNEPKLAQWISDPGSANPSDLVKWMKLVPDGYKQLLNDYGHWIASSVTLGGQFRSKLTITKTQYETTSSDQEEFNTSLNGVLEGIDLGASLSTKSGTFSQSTRDTADVVSENETSGGVPGTDYNAWAATVSGAPVPVQAQFRHLADLLSADYFPTDSIISSKAQLLRGLTAAHMVLDAPKLNAGDPSKAFFTQKAPTYKITLVKARSNDWKRLVPRLYFKVVDKNLEDVPFNVVSGGVDSSIPNSRGFAVNEPSDVVVTVDFDQNFTGDEVVISSASASGLRNGKVHFFGTLVAFGILDPAHATNTKAVFPERGPNPGSLDSYDVDLSTLKPGDGPTVNLDYIVTDGNSKVTFTFRVDRIQ